MAPFEILRALLAGPRIVLLFQMIQHSKIRKKNRLKINLEYSLLDWRSVWRPRQPARTREQTHVGLSRKCAFFVLNVVSKVYFRCSMLG